MIPINIRLAHHNDAPILAERVITVQNVHRDVMPNRYKPMYADDPKLVALYEDAIANSDNAIFIAEVENKAVGHVYCQFHQTPDNLFVYSISYLHIDQMTVDEAYQGMGVGKALMTSAIKHAKALNVDRITLGVMAFNERAKKFYKQFGFEVSSHRMSVMLNDVD